MTESVPFPEQVRTYPRALVHTYMHARMNRVLEAGPRRIDAWRMGISLPSIIFPWRSCINQEAW